MTILVLVTRAGRLTDRCGRKDSISELASPEGGSAQRTPATAEPEWPPAGPVPRSSPTASSTSSATTESTLGTVQGGGN